MPSTASSPLPVRVVVGVDGSGRSHRLGVLAAAFGADVVQVIAPAADPEAFSAQLADAAAAGRAVVVDDVHRLDDTCLRALTAAGRRGVVVLVSRRPTIDRAPLAELDEVLARAGSVEDLQPLDVAAIHTLVAALRGRPPQPEEVASILDASAGLPALAAAIAVAPGPDPATAVAARVGRRLAQLDPATARLAGTLATGVPLPDDVLAAASGLTLTELPTALRRLTDEGFLAPDGDHLVPAVAAAIELAAGPAGRRAARAHLASALVDAGGDPVSVAGLLRDARARGAIAVQAFAAAAQAVRFNAPAEALGWLDDAADAGGSVPEGVQAPLRAIRAEASALLGLATDTTPIATSGPGEIARLRLVEAAVAAHEGRTERCADLLRDNDGLERLLAIPSLIATGRPYPEAGAGIDDPHLPRALRLLAEAARAATDPRQAVPAFIEAAEALESDPPELVLPDSAHALGALVAVSGGDAATAERLLHRAIATGVGGPVAVDRHRLLLGWVRMRVGRYDTALAEVQRDDSSHLGGRDRVVQAALLAGLARRSGDIARMRQAWTAVEPVLARRAVDLFHVEVVEELAVAAARLHHPQRIEPVLALLEQYLAGLGGPTAWARALGWTRLQMAVAADDATLADAAADRLERTGSGPGGPDARTGAARVWASVVSGTVDETAVTSAVDGLAGLDLPWEASRLAGQAAINSTDATAARRLLERARELSSPEARGSAPSGPTPGVTSDAQGARAGLSEREVEVARLVLEGRTHREIGSQLYLSPKTVEHHVARIRTKLGATTRAELLASLRDLLP